MVEAEREQECNTLSEHGTMNNKVKPGDARYSGLRPAEESAFPKKCRNCGRVFETAEDFFEGTSGIKSDMTGLQQLIDEDALVMVEAFRNCPCGSTLLDNFNNRRDMSAAGDARRKRFDELLTYLIQSGLDEEIAYAELLKVSRGGESEVLANIEPPK